MEPSKHSVLLISALCFSTVPVSASSQQPVKAPLKSAHTASEPRPGTTSDHESDPPAPAEATARRNRRRTHQPGQLAVPGFTLFAPRAYWKKFKTGVPKLEVGRWARYRIVDDSHDYGHLRIAVVREQAYKAVEVRHDQPTGDRSYVKTVLSGGLDTLRNIVAVQVKAPGIPAMTLPVGSSDAPMDIQTTTSQRALARARVRYLGQKRIETPAGVFETWHYRVAFPKEAGGTVSQLWLDSSGKVPLFRIVRMIADGKRIELTKVGDDALSELPPIDATDLPPVQHSH